MVAVLIMANMQQLQQQSPSEWKKQNTKQQQQY